MLKNKMNIKTVPLQYILNSENNKIKWSYEIISDTESEYEIW